VRKGGVGDGSPIRSIEVACNWTQNKLKLKQGVMLCYTGNQWAVVGERSVAGAGNQGVILSKSIGSSSTAKKDSWEASVVSGNRYYQGKEKGDKKKKGNTHKTSGLFVSNHGENLIWEGNSSKRRECGKSDGD